MTKHYRQPIPSVQSLNQKFMSIAFYLQQVAGPRCGDFEPDCPCCKMWAAYDNLKKQVDDVVTLSNE